MAQHEIFLKLRELVGGDARVGEQAEAGVDAVGGSAAVEYLLNDGGTAVELGEAVGVERQLHRLTQDAAQRQERDRRGADSKIEAHLASSEGRMRPLSRAQSIAMS